MLKCATFDLDDTLWAVDPVIRQANQNLWQWLEENGGAFTRLHSPADLVEGSQVRAQLLAEQPEIAHSMTLVRLRLLERGLQAAGFAPQEAQARAAQAFQVFMRARHEVELFEHAFDMLKQLRTQGLTIGALSNGNADVSLTGIGELFDFQYNADSVGSAKPDPLMFQRALEHTGLRPSRWCISATTRSTMCAPRARWAAGLSGSTWRGSIGRSPAQADERVDSLAQIPAALERIRQRARKRFTL